jgi:hypothetical protein
MHMLSGLAVGAGKIHSNPDRLLYWVQKKPSAKQDAHTRPSHPPCLVTTDVAGWFTFVFGRSVVTM